MIKPADTNDAVELSALVNSAYRGDSSRKGWTTEADLLDGSRTDAAAIGDLLKKPGTTILKYLADGRISGCVELVQDGDKIYLGMLTVSPGLQGKGIGKQLLSAAERYASEKQCKAIFMTVISVRQELIAWYLRHGYHDTGGRKNFEVPDVRWGIPKTKLEFAILEKPMI